MISELYLINDKLESICIREASKYVFKEVEFSEGISRFEDFIHLSLIDQLKSKLEDNIKVQVCYLTALVEVQADVKIISFHAEHAIIMLCSFWEHIFQSLNTYLRVNMGVRKQILKSDDEIWNIVNTSSGDERNKNNTLGRYNFIKRIKKNFINDNYLRAIVNISSSKDYWKRLIDIRNEIVHCNYLGQVCSINYVGEDGSKSMSFNTTNNRLNYRELIKDLGRALIDLYRALELFEKIIKQDLSPKRKGTEQTTYKLSKISCNKCSPNKIKAIPKEFVELENKREDKLVHCVFCPDCLSDDINILNEDFIVSEMLWEDVYSHYRGLLYKYFDKKLEEIDVVESQNDA